MKKQWYEELFENYSQRYDNEVFTQGTSGECDFLEKEMNYIKSLKILDVGCGDGITDLGMFLRYQPERLFEWSRIAMQVAGG